MAELSDAVVVRVSVRVILDVVRIRSSKNALFRRNKNWFHPRIKNLASSLFHIWKYTAQLTVPQNNATVITNL